MAELKAIARECGLRGYSRLRKAELIALLQNDLHPTPAPRPIPAPRTRPTRPPPQLPLVRFRPDRPRQPELLRKLEERNPQPPPLTPTLKPCQLKTRRGKETFIEPPAEQKGLPPNNPKKLKRMKKMLDELNRKIRHSRKKHNGLIHKRNSLRKAIEGLKHGTKPEVLETRMAEPVPEPDWTSTECEQAFNGAYRSYRFNGRPKMDVDNSLVE